MSQKVSATSYQSIESLATFIANHALESLPQTVVVTVRKPSALPFAAAVGLTIKRPFQQQEGHEVYIALGSNLGDRIGTIERALKLLGSSGIHIQDVSGLYESDPMYVQQQPQFLNAVCKVS
jgi:dihydroneopterin aldolase / 2-amino-4-hydroxy-6-hydroxymethyldihydropteridine diphosphokinase / dihydropteroate synthase